MVKKLQEIQFCKYCSSEIEDEETLEWHRDVHGWNNIVPRDQVIVEGDKPTKDLRSDSKKLFDLAMLKIKKLVIADNDRNEVYAVIQNNSHIETINLNSQRAIHWLCTEAMKMDSDKIPSKDLVKNVLNSMISKAQFEGAEIAKVHTRIAQSDEEIWYDLGTEDRKAIKITKQGFGITKLDLKSPLFRTPQSLQEQVLPQLENENALDEYCDLLLISPNDRMLFKVCLISLFLPKIPTPIIILDGPAGTFKTTTGGSIKRIVDPSGKTMEDNVSSMQKKDKDLGLQLVNRYLVCFDNVSQITQDQSDILCRSITGNSIQARKLYTDSDEVIQTIKRKIVLNGIVPNTNYPDLQTRSIKISRDIPDNVKRITEKEFNERFEKLLPHILGKCFRLLSKSLSWYKSLKYDIKPKSRMADFEVWGEILSQMMGYKPNKFLNRYSEKLKEDVIESEDAYPIVTTILNLMQNTKIFQDSVSQTYKELRLRAENLGIDIKSQYVRFPKGSNKLRSALIQVKPILDANLISYDFFRYTKNDNKFPKGDFILRITKRDIQTKLKVENLSSPSSLSSPLVNQEQNWAESGEDTSEGKTSNSNQSSPENIDSRHENQTSEHGEGGEDTLEKS